MNLVGGDDIDPNKKISLKSDEIIIKSISLSLSILPFNADPNKAIASTWTSHFINDFFKKSITSFIVVLSIIELL